MTSSLSLVINEKKVLLITGKSLVILGNVSSLKCCIAKGRHLKKTTKPVPTTSNAENFVPVALSSSTNSSLYAPSVASADLARSMFADSIFPGPVNVTVNVQRSKVHVQNEV